MANPPNLIDITTSHDGYPRGLTATTGIDHCLWHHGGCSSAAAVAAAICAWPVRPCRSSCAKHPRGVPTADLSKKARRTAFHSQNRCGSRSVAKPRGLSTLLNAFQSAIGKGFQARSATRPRTEFRNGKAVRERTLARSDWSVNTDSPENCAIFRGSCAQFKDLSTIFPNEARGDGPSRPPPRATLKRAGGHRTRLRAGSAGRSPRSMPR